MKLGDAVHSVLHPLAEHVIDPVLGTDLANCGGCAGRRQLLNKIDLWRGSGNVEAMTYHVTVNTQKQYRVEATSSDEALTKISDETQIFAATTNNVRLEPKAPAGSPAANAAGATPA